MDEKPRSHTRLVTAAAILIGLIIGGVGLYVIRDYRAALERVGGENRRPRQMSAQQMENLERQLSQFADQLRHRLATSDTPSSSRAGPVPEDVDRGMLFDAIRPQQPRRR